MRHWTVTTEVVGEQPSTNMTCVAYSALDALILTLQPYLDDGQYTCLSLSVKVGGVAAKLEARTAGGKDLLVSVRELDK